MVGLSSAGYMLVPRYMVVPQDFMFIIEMPQNGIGVIVDWVPGHFLRWSWLSLLMAPTFTNTLTPQRRTQRVGYAGIHSRHEVRNFLVSNALFWFEYH